MNLSSSGADLRFFFKENEVIMTEEKVSVSV